jgi:hypothetical protein
MERPSSRPWILALALAACRNDSGTGSSALVVRSISVPDFGSWECNRPIEFAFGERIDFASVSARSIHIRTSLGVPAVGTFAAKPIDADGDGVPERTDERVVVFFPSCPLAGDLLDAGFTPGARYLVTLAGEDSGADPDALLRSVSGNTLPKAVVRVFETIADPARTLHDEKPGAPLPLVRAAGASAGPGCHLELGGDPSNRVFFAGSPASGRTPSGFATPLNLLGDPATHVAAVVVFDQAIRTTPANLALLRLEYSPLLTSSGWSPLDTRVEVLSNCRPAEVVVRLVPLGTFPPGGFVRVRIEAGFQDVAGEATLGPLDQFAVTEVRTVAFTSLDPDGAIADGLREEFALGSGSTLSLADPEPLPDVAPALWGEGELRSNVGPPPFALTDFDWIVRVGEDFVLDTTATPIEGGPDGAPTTIQETRGGSVRVRNLTVERGGRILVRGPNPMVLQASGSVLISGIIDANGSSAPNLLPLEEGIGLGGPGSAGGGAGGSGSPGAGARGSDGSAALGAGAGGRGGESGFSPSARPRDFRGGGGGGGRFAADQGMQFAEDGGDGGPAAMGAESALPPPKGGASSPPVFTDGDPLNDYFGVLPVVDASGNLGARRRGELHRVHAGVGGGNGGDSISAADFPPPATARIQEGGGGGGGGGAVVIRALGPIVFGQEGQIHANGGSGGRRGVPFDVRDHGGACGGSGSGGHVILESATAIDFTAGNGSVPLQRVISALGGPRSQSGDAPRGFGGQGGPGVVQLHVPHPEREPGDPSSGVILPPFANALVALCVPAPFVLFTTSGARSSARSRWIDLGAAGEGGAGRPESVVAFLFDGIETAPGEDHGKVRTNTGRVVELAPVLGRVQLLQPGVELLPDGLSLALSGPVLAPLRANAQPISPDVYLRTPALLEGFTLRLANVLGPELLRDLTISGARYDDATSRLTLSVGGLSGTLAEVVEEIGGVEQVELALVPRFFRVRHGSVPDLLPD